MQVFYLRQFFVFDNEINLLERYFCIFNIFPMLYFIEEKCKKLFHGNYCDQGKIKMAKLSKAMLLGVFSFTGALLVACGGGGSATLTDIFGPDSVGPGVTTAPIATTTTTTTTTSLPIGATATTLQVDSTGTGTQNNVPLTFGQVFVKGEIGANESITGALGDGTPLALQVDAKAYHADGSLRHAVISTVLPQLTAGQTQAIQLVKTTAYTATPSATALTDFLNGGFDAKVNITLGGEEYSVSAATLLKSGTVKTWLAGPHVNEWIVAAPLKKNADGSEHPHLTVQFAIRHYVGQSKARVDVTIENAWAYEPNPQNFTYDAQIMVGGTPVYTKTGMTHYHHARWRKTFWWGAEPQAYVKHNTAYLIASRAVPNYDQSVKVAESALAALQSGWTGAKTEPMGVGQAMAAMPTTGGRPDIGLLPGWTAMYVLSMDKRAWDVTRGTADLSGSWSSHYRDKTTGRPVSLLDYPYMTILGTPGDTYNPVTKQKEAFPTCAAAGSCATPNHHDTSHQPSLTYLPYLVTGDYYYLEELQFWAMWNSFSSNPGYRENVKGLYSPDQVRGQAWSLRTLSQAAYITPDQDPLKSHFNAILNNNLDWYNAEYSSNASANKLGIITNGYAVVYDSGTGVAPWQDDFFTSAVGYTAELGFDKAKPLLAWKAKFPIGRMVGAGYCWIDGSIYAMKVRDSAASPFYATIGQAYTESHTSAFNALACASAEMAAALGLKVGEMTGYSSANTGYPSNMQPALAYSANSGAANGALAWQQFMQRTVKPNYAAGPQFAIVPR